MKALYTLPLALLFSSNLHAQITIGQAEMPTSSSELIRTKAVTNPFINYAATGAEYTWNFATLAADEGDTTRYQTVASTNFLYAIVYSDLPFNPNRANHAKPGTDIAFSQLLPIQNPYTFRNRSATQYKTVGFGVELSGIPVPIIFDEQDVIYQLPLAYGATSASHSAYHVEIPNVGYYGFDQDRTNAVDGWGVITTPGGTFDVLRVKTTLTMRDSLFGFSIDRPVTREYKWLAQGLRVPVLQVNTTSLFGTEVVTAIYYYDVPRTIDVAAPLAASLCPGASFNLNFTSTGAFNAGGIFVPANQFRAQLSDATGSFAAPVNIGSVTATASGSIAVTIPANTAPGTGYRIRVISTSPDHVGTSNTFDITIGGPATAAISAAGPIALCTGGSVELNAVGGPGYQWFRNAVLLDGATEANYTATLEGVYTVEVDNACGTALSNEIAVEMNTVPTHSVDDLERTICAGASTTIVGVNASATTAVSYQWYLNDALVASATDDSLDATLPGQYTLVTTDDNTGCTATTEPVTVAVETIATLVIDATDGTTACTGSTVTLSIASQANTVQWYRDDVPLAITTETLVVDQSGVYTVRAFSELGCASDMSAAVEVTIVEPPAIPEVIITEPTSFCTGGGVTFIADAGPDVAYQWTNNGDAIDGATASQYTALTSGAYALTVSNTACSVNTPTVDVVVFPLPDVPVITTDGSELTASGTGTYQWFLDNVLIDGAVNANYTPEQNGSYTVELTDANGCSSVSEALVWLSTGISNGHTDGIHIAPNPGTGVFTISGAMADRYEVVDTRGRIVDSGRSSGDVTRIDLSHVSPGLYYVRIPGTLRALSPIMIVR